MARVLSHKSTRILKRTSSGTSNDKSKGSGRGQHCFTVGVGFFLLTQFIFSQRTDVFPLWYPAVLIVGYLIRAADYWKRNYGFFMIDFCYFAGALSILSTYFPTPILMRATFAISNGPLACANMVWSISLVFHKFDSMYGISLHTFPALASFLSRWYDHSDEFLDAGFLEIFALGFLSWCFWQSLYLLITEVIFWDYLDTHPESETSLRWLAKDSRKAVNKIGVLCARRLGTIGSTDVLDGNALATKLLFVTLQIVYVAVSLLPGVLCCYSYTFHVIWLMFIFGAVVYNGARYYHRVQTRAIAADVKTKEILGSIVPPGVSRIQLAGA